MFKVLKRIASALRKPAAKPPPSRPTPPSAASLWKRLTGPGPLDPLPVGEVQELHDESAWDQWEHSQMELDSRLGPLSAFDSVKVKEASPSQVADLDPFSDLRKT